MLPTTARVSILLTVFMWMRALTAMKYVASLLGKDNISMKEVKEWTEEQEGDDFIYVHEFEIEN